MALARLAGRASLQHGRLAGRNSARKRTRLAASHRASCAEQRAWVSGSAVCAGNEHEHGFDAIAQERACPPPAEASVETFAVVVRTPCRWRCRATGEVPDRSKPMRLLRCFAVCRLGMGACAGCAAAHSPARELRWICRDSLALQLAPPLAGQPCSGRGLLFDGRRFQSLRLRVQSGISSA
jgi:hypothetical protein